MRGAGEGQGVEWRWEQWGKEGSRKRQGGEGAIPVAADAARAGKSGASDSIQLN